MPRCVGRLCRLIASLTDANSARQCPGLPRAVLGRRSRRWPDGAHLGQGERDAAVARGRAPTAPRALPPRRARPHRDPRRLRHQPVRKLHGDARRPDCEVVHHVRGAGGWERGAHHRGARRGRKAAPGSRKLLGGARTAVRLLHPGAHPLGRGAAPGRSTTRRTRHPRRHRGESLPLHRVPQRREGGAVGGAEARRGAGRCGFSAGTGPIGGTPMATVERLVGKAIRRREDPRFITGRGTFTDDVKLPGTHHAVFVRSSLAHARIVNIDASRAMAHSGVRAVFTGKDLADGGVNPIPVGWLLPGLKTPDFRAIAVDRVHHVGEAVAVVVAETAALARDAAELVHVDYEELPVVVDAVAALRPGAPQVHAGAPDNRAFHWEIGDLARTESALRGAAKVVRTRLINQRLIANAIEPRASLASYHGGTDELTLWVTSQNPHVHRLIMGAFVLGLPEHEFRVISPDVGGGFGSKIFVYTEEVAVAWLARKLGVPVKWTAQRSESFVTDMQGRDLVSEVV